MSGKKRYNLNENYFDSIDCEEKAYWLGFLIADGYIGIKKNKISYLSIDLQLSDIEHLEKFKKCVAYSGPIFNDEKRNRCRLIITNMHMANKLDELGISNKKSLTAKPIFFDNDLLQRSFWRGCIDGDGTIIKFTPKDRKYAWCIGLYGTKEIVENFAIYIKKITGSKSNNFQKRGKIMHFRVNGNSVTKKACSHLYSNASIYLNRKKEKANVCMGNW